VAIDVRLGFCQHSPRPSRIPRHSSCEDASFPCSDANSYLCTFTHLAADSHCDINPNRSATDTHA
jgi:hypothetical protein